MLFYTSGTSWAFIAYTHSPLLLLCMKCFSQFYKSGNFREALNDATAAVKLEQTSIKAIKTGKILDSTDL